MITKDPTTSRPLALATERSNTQRKSDTTAMISLDSFPPAYRISFRRRVIPLIVKTNTLLTLLFLARIAISIPIVVDAEAADVPIPPNPSSVFPIQLKKDPFDADWGDCDDEATAHDSNDGDNSDGRKRSPRLHSAFYGFGREFSLFESAPRGGARNDSYNNDYSYEGPSEDTDEDEEEDNFLKRMERRYRERRKSNSSISSGSYNNEGYALSRGGRPSYILRSQSERRGLNQEQQQNQKPKIVQRAQSWWMDNVDPKLQSLPKIVARVEPTTTLKLRKTFRPLKTIIRLGADYNTQQGIWQFKSSWEDAIIGGKITLSGGKELQVTKSWHLSVGGVEDLVTRLRFRATINLQTFQAHARIGFRTERLTPIDVVEGFTVLKRLPLDGSGGNLKLEVKANVALPEPEIEYSTEAQRSLIGMGNIEVSIDEANLLLDY